MGRSKKVQVLVKRLVPSAILPTRTHTTDTGFDLYALEDLLIAPGDASLIATGIAIALPGGTEAQIRPRSGLARDHCVTVLNAPGSIDEGYRGEIGVILINHGRNPFHVMAGMRIAQLVVQPRLRVDLLEVGSLTDTVRGTGGFGSTND